MIHQNAELGKLFKP